MGAEFTASNGVESLSGSPSVPYTVTSPATYSCQSSMTRISKPTPDGRTELVLSPLQLLERLVAFVPLPRMHRHRYHGVLAPHAGLRSAVVAIGRAPAETPCPADGVTPHPVPGDLDELPRFASPARIRWAVLLARIYEVLPLLCPACGGSMKILAFITDPPVVSAILVHLDLPNKPPPLAPARGPPQRDFLLDQTSSFDPADPEPVPDFQFDQSLPDDFGD